MTARRVDRRRALAVAIAAWLAVAHAAQAATRPELDTCDSPSIILILVDTLRADHLGTYGHTRFTSPELDAHARRGAVFERAFATSPWTLPTVASLFTGVLPSAHGAGRVLHAGRAAHHAQMRETIPTLAEHLRAFGYRTYAVAGNPNLHPRFGMARGFEAFNYHAGDPRRIRRADVIVDEALTLVRRAHGAPFFLFVHFFDPHMNYDPPPPVRGRFTAGLDPGRLTLPFAETERLAAGLRLTRAEQEWVGAAYDEEIAFVDMQLGRFFQRLQQAGVWDRSIVVFTADHGEEHWDHGWFEHGHSLYDELVRAPLVVWGPGIAPGRIDTPVSLVDLPPTLCAALAAPPMPEPAGESLWGLLTTGAPVPARRLIAESPRYGPDSVAVIGWPHKLIVDLKSGTQRLFDLERDGAERINLEARERGVAASLRHEVEGLVAAKSKRALPAAAPLDEATREQLRALGYLP
jgi:arylsulfatase A-like enzyme